VAADIMVRLAMMKRQSSSMAGSEAYRFVIFQRETSFDPTVKCIVIGRTSAKESDINPRTTSRKHTRPSRNVCTVEIFPFA
jgi:hypothetical protein